MGDGRYCYPLTITDGFSRYLLACEALGRPTEEYSRVIFDRVFREYGLPWAIRTDNGAPFASPGVRRLSRLGAWWLKLGIRPEHIEPGHPEQNGRHERMHRTLKREATKPPEAELGSQQRRFGEFRREYNEERPHEALGQIPPAEVYQRSTREYPTKLTEPEYPSHYEVRRVESSGIITWKCARVYVSASLDGERLGLLEVEEDVWRVYFGTYELGVIDGRRKMDPNKLRKVLPMCPV
jgi:hypothetical protein